MLSSARMIILKHKRAQSGCKWSSLKHPKMLSHDHQPLNYSHDMS